MNKGKGKARADPNADNEEESNNSEEIAFKVTADKNICRELCDKALSIKQAIKDFLKLISKMSKQDWIVHWYQNQLDIPLDTKISICIINLLNFHMMSWSNIQANSLSCIHKEVIAIAIAKYCAIGSYHEDLLDNIYKGTVYIDATLECIITAYFQPSHRQPPCSDEITVLQGGGINCVLNILT